MENDNIEKLQKIEKEMLRELVSIFKKNNIDFYLAYGTTLGCVRHHGFIPWDDDVDIYIWGKDYPKIKEIFSTQDTGFLKLHDFFTEKEYPYAIPKVVDTRTQLKEKAFEHLSYVSGVYIDLFPLIEVEDNLLIRKIAGFSRYMKYALIRAYFMKDTNLSGIKRVVSILSKKLPIESIQNSLYKTCISEKTKGYMLNDPLNFNSKVYVNKDIFDETEWLDFEDIKVPVPKKYDEYLKVMYGDYMQLPKEEDRVSLHNFSFLQI